MNFECHSQLDKYAITLKKRKTYFQWTKDQLNNLMQTKNLDGRKSVLSLNMNLYELHACE